MSVLYIFISLLKYRVCLKGVLRELRVPLFLLEFLSWEVFSSDDFLYTYPWSSSSKVTCSSIPLSIDPFYFLVLLVLLFSTCSFECAECFSSYVHQWLRLIIIFLHEFCSSSPIELIKVLISPPQPYQVVSRVKRSTKLMEMFITVNEDVLQK